MNEIQWPLHLLHAAEETAEIYENPKHLCTNLEWYDTTNPLNSANETLVDNLGRRVYLKLAHLEIMELRLEESEPHPQNLLRLRTWKITN